MFDARTNIHRASEGREISLSARATSQGWPADGATATLADHDEHANKWLVLTLAVVTPLAGRLADRVGSAWLSPLGLAIACSALLLLSGLTQASSTMYLILCLIVAAIGQGLFMSPNTRALMDAAPSQEQGEASGMLATARVVGQSMSVAAAGAVFTSFGAAAAGAPLEAGRGTLRVQQVQALQDTFVAGLHAAFLVCVALAAVGVVTALVRGKETA